MFVIDLEVVELGAIFRSGLFGLFDQGELLFGGLGTGLGTAAICGTADAAGSAGAVGC